LKETNSKKKLGIWMSTSLVVGNMVGAGIFLMPAALAAYGGISVIGWLVSAAGALILARVFSQLSLLVPNSDGGPYAFARAGFGDYLGFLVAWGYWISIWVSNAAIAIAFVAAMSIFFPMLAESRIAAVLAALAAIWFLTWINSKGIQESGKIQILTTVLKLIPLFLIIAFGFFYFDIDNFTPFNTSGKDSWAAIAVTATMTFYAFLGFECATIPAANVENPEKTVPRATMIGTILTTIFYILGTVVVMGMIPMDILAKSPAPYADAMGIIGGEWGKNLVAAGAAIAAFGALNGWILIQGQIARATAMDDLFPSIFKRDNRNGVPIWGLVIGSGLTSVVMLMNYTDGLVEQFRFMVLLTTLCSLIPYLFSAAAYVLIALEKSKPQKNKMAIHVLGGIAFLFTLWAIFGAGERTVFWGTLLLLAGTPFYVWMKRKK
jgi:APA family basic amino acid/polyamine antiporter